LTKERVKTMQIAAYVGIAAVTFVAIYLLAKKLQGKKSKRPAKPGTVVLHQFPRSMFNVIMGSPPCLKLETFLRMTKIPFESEYVVTFSKKGKMPWIEFNGQAIADSNFCIRFLEKEFQVDADSHLSATERAIGHSIRTMLEENTFWTIAYTRWVSDYGTDSREKMLGHLPAPVKYLTICRVTRRMKNNLWSHGIGRHTEQELYGIAERDLLAVSDILGEKRFLFGDKPCLADASLFAFIVTSAWEFPKCPIGELIKSKAKNLDQHAQRMKELYYPDWDEIMSKKRKSE